MKNSPESQPTSLSKITPAEAATELLRRRMARKRLVDFCKYTLATYQSADHLNVLASKLEQVEQGLIKRLIIVAPPRHGKSEKATVRFPCWYMAKHPNDYIVQAGYGASIALTQSRKARDVFVSPEMTTLFPHVHHRPETPGQDVIIPARQSAHEWGTTSGGSYYAVGIGGGLTGRGFNLGIIDDPVKDEEEANSHTIREKVWNWYSTVFRTRAQPDAAIVIIMTRWHQSDLVGRLLKQAEEDPEADQWEVVHFEAIETIDGKEHALWPARYPIDVLRKIRSTIGARFFTALYQGNPTVAEGQIIKREWWQYYRDVPKFEYIIQSWDTAFKDKEMNDYSVCGTWGVAKHALCLLAVWRGKVELPELKRVAVALYNKGFSGMIPIVVLIEDKASGQSLIQEFQRNTTIPVLPVKVDKNKVARANASTPLIEAGKVHLPISAPWLHDYIEECSAFPNATHDDQVDMTTQALEYMRGEGQEVEAIITLDPMEAMGISMDL